MHVQLNATVIIRVIVNGVFWSSFHYYGCTKPGLILSYICNDCSVVYSKYLIDQVEWKHPGERHAILKWRLFSFSFFPRKDFKFVPWGLLSPILSKI